MNFNILLQCLEAHDYCLSSLRTVYAFINSTVRFLKSQMCINKDGMMIVPLSDFIS
jgi:hypothetical protein